MPKQSIAAFSLTQVITEVFEVFAIPSKFNMLKLQNAMNIRFGWAEEAEDIGVNVECRIRLDGKDLIHISVVCGFKFEDYSQFEKEDRTIYLPKEIAQLLAAITYSTCRGVLHAKTENTAANQIFLPIGNMVDLITEEMILVRDVKQLELPFRKSSKGKSSKKINP